MNLIMNVGILLLLIVYFVFLLLTSIIKKTLNKNKILIIGLGLFILITGYINRHELMAFCTTIFKNK